MCSNYLYMFDFLVNDIFITRTNKCAPPEYPICVEFTFRSSVFVSICDCDYGKEVEKCLKNGKCCLFALEKPVNDSDLLYIHVYKKRSEKCKFLIGAAQMPIKYLFDAVTKKYEFGNANDKLNDIKKAKAGIHLPVERQQNGNGSKGNRVETEDNENGNTDRDRLSKISVALKSGSGIDKDSLGKHLSRTSSSESDKSYFEEKMVASEIVKKVTGMFNLKNKPTGSITVIIRLSCMGETITSPFIFGPQKKCKDMQKNIKEKLKHYQQDINKDSYSCEKFLKTIPSESFCSDDNKSDNQTEVSRNLRRPSEDDCHPVHDKYPYGLEAATKDSSLAYDEFEANMNQNGLVVRVLKNNHKVNKILDDENDIGKDDVLCCCCHLEKATYSDPKKRGLCSELHHGSCNNCCNHMIHDCCNSNKNLIHPKQKYDLCETPSTSLNNHHCSGDPCESILKSMHDDPFVRNYVQRKTGGQIENDSGLPIVRGNIKYPGNMKCGANFTLPSGDYDPDNLNKYKKKPVENRTCCLQVNNEEIDNAMQGITEKIPNGIEICKKGSMDPDTDVFVFKLGKKMRSENKENLMEIELKTPKGPVDKKKEKITRETQVEEALLNTDLGDAGGKTDKIKKVKGKAEQKGKGKKMQKTSKGKGK